MKKNLSILLYSSHYSSLHLIIPPKRHSKQLNAMISHKHIVQHYNSEIKSNQLEEETEIQVV